MTDAVHVFTLTADNTQIGVVLEHVVAIQGYDKTSSRLWLTTGEKLLVSGGLEQVVREVKLTLMDSTRNVLRA